MPDNDVNEFYQPKIQPMVYEVDNDLSERDLHAFINAAVEENGLVDYNLLSFNRFMDEGIRKIVLEQYKIDTTIPDVRTATEMDQNRTSIRIEIGFTDIMIGKPEMVLTPLGDTVPLYPNQSRIQELTYSAPMFLGARIALTAGYKGGKTDRREVDIPMMKIAMYPIMIGSNRCHTYNMPRELKKGIEEDPIDPGGYFIIKGGEWVITASENTRFNTPHIHKNMEKTEHVRVELISQPAGTFENSSQIVIQYLKTNLIVISINSTKIVNKVMIPFQYLYKIFGINSEREIIRLIVQDPNSDLGSEMLDILEKSVLTKDKIFDVDPPTMNRTEILHRFTREVNKAMIQSPAYISNEDAIQHLNSQMITNLDISVLPHIGHATNLRTKKMQFISILIRKMLLVHLGVMEPTDRVTYQRKRIHDAGVSLAKNFKSHFYQTIVKPVLNSLTEKSITSAAKSGNGGRIVTLPLERKNELNSISTRHAINMLAGASKMSKGTARAEEIRQVHPSYIGFICVSQSADTGEKVGMVKQLAITATISQVIESENIKMNLIDDPSLILPENVDLSTLISRGLATVYLNGELLGCCWHAHEFVRRYRNLRREGRILHQHTTIYWDTLTNEVQFWTDVGRVVRPMIIVRNNLTEFENAAKKAWIAKKSGETNWKNHEIPFIQNISLTKKHIRELLQGSKTMNDLVKLGICEYITPEEHENVYAAFSLSKLRQHTNDYTNQFTHMDIQQAILGIPAHVSPFGNHTQPARVTYETNQARQTCGRYCNSYPFRMDNGRFMQPYNEMPFVKTISHKYVPPNGINTIVAYCVYGGFNQEDSAIVSKGFVDRGGFGGSMYRVEKTELDKNEIFCTPDPVICNNLRVGASYEKLIDGFVPVGTVVKKGDVLIGKVLKNYKRTDGKNITEIVDRSVIYKYEEPAIVERVIQTRGQNDEQFSVVKLRYDRPLTVGEKMCLTADHSVMTSDGDWKCIECITTSDRVLILKNGETEFMHPTHTYEYDVVDEDIYTFEGEYTIQRVTGNHRVYVAQSEDAAFGFYRADEVCKWDQIYLSPGCGSINYEYPISDHRIELLAHTLFGKIVGNTVTIDHNEKVYNICEILNIDCEKVNNTIIVNDIEHLDDMGTKGIPKIVYQLSTRQKQLFIECTQPTITQHYATLTELWMHILPERDLVIPVTVSKYTGKVYCISVDDNAFYVCNNNKKRGSWTGNSSRSGNKCICALLLPNSDMPFTEDGLTPDIFINPHSIPSRMTIGQILETMLGLTCAEQGIVTDGTSFNKIDIGDIPPMLEKSGFRKTGLSQMYNGMTGEYFDSLIFIGPTYHQRLQKFAEDDSRAVLDVSSINQLTHQPRDGKIGGEPTGLKLGSMEVDGMVAHGSMMSLTEKLCEHSDGLNIHVCRNCNRQAMYYPLKNIYKCLRCNNNADICTIPSSRAANLFRDEVESCNIAMDLVPKARMLPN